MQERKNIQNEFRENVIEKLNAIIQMARRRNQLMNKNIKEVTDYENKIEDLKKSQESFESAIKRLNFSDGEAMSKYIEYYEKSKQELNKLLEAEKERMEIRYKDMDEVSVLSNHIEELLEEITPVILSLKGAKLSEPVISDSDVCELILMVLIANGKNSKLTEKDFFRNPDILTVYMKKHRGAKIVKEVYDRYEKTITALNSIDFLLVEI